MPDTSRQAGMFVLPTLLYCIPFHFNPHRLVWLELVLDCISRFDCPVDVRIHTNTANDIELASISKLLDRHSFSGARIVSFDALGHPFDLTWQHKATIREEFQTGPYTHFIYAEDDLLISAETFRYWLEYRPRLASRGVIPSFIRVERRADDGALLATDQFARTQLDWTRIVPVGEWHFTNIDSPYLGCFVLDRALAAEYVKSRSFERDSSALVKNWEVRERAAMGLTFEQVPRFFWHRLVVPFDRSTFRIPDCAHIVHAPANYANDPASRLAKLSVDSLLLRPTLRNFAHERWLTARRVFRR